MHYSSYNVSISVCMQHIIVNLSINTLQLMKYSYKAIEYLRNLLEFNGSQDARLRKSSKIMEAVLLDENSYNRSHNRYSI